MRIYSAGVLNKNGYDPHDGESAFSSSYGDGAHDGNGYGNGNGNGGGWGYGDGYGLDNDTEGEGDIYGNSLDIMI